MKNWKKMWQEELDNITPELSEEVKNAPIPTQRQAVTSFGDVAVKSRYNQRNLIIIVTAVVLCLVIVGTIIALTATPKNGLFTVEINPAISLVTDKHGNVTNVIASNADADVILSSQEARSNMVGKSIDKAVEYYVDCAARLGYIDLDAVGSAVRVSAYADKNADKALRNISSSLQSYFAEKGVFAVVVADAVDARQYCERSGLQSGTSVNKIADILRRTETLTVSRNAQSMTDEQRQSVYEGLIGEQLNVNIVESIIGQLDTIELCYVDIQKLYSLNERIDVHDGNDAWLFKDYWRVKDKTFDDDSLNSLISEMETALKDYSTKYGVEINSVIQLSMAKKCLESFEDDIKPLLNLLGDKILDMFSDTISVVVEFSGLVDFKLAELISLPKTVDEYLSKTEQVLQTAFGNRAAEFGETYDKAREAISDADYGAFVDGIVERYGSLDEYWLAVKN